MSMPPLETAPAPGAAPTPAAGGAGRRVRTPTVLQMEAVECGAAALAIILAHHGRYVPLEELRVACGVSRDGSKASNLVRAARAYGMEARGYRREPGKLKAMQAPFIVFWNFNHFLVVEGFGPDRVYLNDPASGPRTVSAAEFDEAFTGVVLDIRPGPGFERGGRPLSLVAALRERLHGAHGAVAFVVVAGLALVVPGLAVPALSEVFVNNVLLGGLTNWVVPLALGLVFSACLRLAFTYLQQRYLARLQAQIALVGSARYLWRVLRLPMEFFGQRATGDVTNRVELNDRVATLLSGDLAAALLGVLTAVFYLAMMLTYNALLTAVATVTMLLNLLALYLVGRARTDGMHRFLQEQTKMMGTAVGGLQSIETLKASGAESDFFARWAGYHAKTTSAEQELGVLTRYLSGVPGLLSGLATAAVLGIGALEVSRGQFSVGALVAFQSLLASVATPVTRIVGLGTSLQEAGGALERLGDVFRYPVDPVVEQTGDLAVGPARLGGHVELRELRFGYSRLEAPLVDGFSLRLGPGDRVALVGGSGSGKSTLGRLVAGLYRPWSGEILFDGVSRTEIARRVLATSLATVDQDIYLFEGTVAENITLWDPTIEEARVVQAAKDACIHDDIAQRPGAYESLVEEGGANFSGGQRQRLEIARALVQDPAVLVLDEATSALDPTTEKRILDNLRHRGCTCLVVAHRLSTIRDCDEIIVLDHGRVVQRGSHDALLQEAGLYAALVTAE